jgi:hypothetical protein
MKLTNHQGLPHAFVKTCQHHDQQRAGIDQRPQHISCTRLIDSPRVHALSQRHAHELAVDVQDRLWALFGQACHQILQWAEPGVLIEERLFTEIEGWTVSGQFDRLALAEGGVLQDYKVTSVWGVQQGPKPEWVRQLNVLRYLAAIAGGHPVARLEVIVILRDHQASAARRDPGYPQTPVVTLPVPLWSLADTGDYLRQRVRLHQQAAQGELPDCTPEERWERPAVYAVCKPGRKTAVRVLPRIEEAEALVAATPGGYLEVRTGEAIRCASYCPVACWCDQYARSLTPPLAQAA